MSITIDPVATAGLVTRELRSGQRDGRPTKIVVASRTYAADRPELWGAVTDPERLPRWFAPVTGDLRVGGRFQVEGNAGGVVEHCEEPERFAVTWEYQADVSWVSVTLTEAADGTLLELAHEAHVDPEFWERFGPGAVGVGWDLALLGLGLHLATGADNDPAEAEAWSLSPDGVRFATLAATGWAEAAVGDGEDPQQARAAAERTTAFFTTAPER